jgi:hypothetical protein
LECAHRKHLRSQEILAASAGVHLSRGKNHLKIGLTVCGQRSSLCATSANYWQPSPIR